MVLVHLRNMGLSYKPAKKLPIEEFLKPQKRFRHMFKPGNEWMIEDFQKEVDDRWNELLMLEEATKKNDDIISKG